MIRILAREILNDIRNGMGDDELMEKYQLSVESLERLMGRLVARKAIGHKELQDRSSLYRKFVDRFVARESNRMRIGRPLRVYHDDTAQKGFVRDIARNGVRVAGIKATVGDLLTLRLPLKELEGTDPIEFVAECRWSKIEGRRKEYMMCGFKIREISETARIQFDGLTTLLQGESRRLGESHAPVIGNEMRGDGIATPDKERYPRKFSGKVDDVDILDVVQFLLLIGKTTVLAIVSSEGTKSHLYLKNGILVHADLEPLRGEEAFFACMDWPGGEFLFEPWCEPSDITIHDPGELLLVEAARRRDESVR